MDQIEQVRTLQDIIDIYKDLNWEFKELDSVEKYKEQIKPEISMSFGGKTPYFENGLLVQIPVNIQEGAYLLLAYSSQDTSYLDKIPKDTLKRMIKNATRDSSSFPNDEDELNNIIETFDKNLSIYNIIIGRVFIIEHNNLQHTINYLFMHEDGKVPGESIVVKDKEGITLLLSQEFKNRFDDVSQSDYAISVILSAISFILEQFK